MICTARTLLAAGFLTFALTGAGSADILFAGGLGVPATNTPGTTDFEFVPLFDGGAGLSVTVGFSAPAGTKVAVTYNAECKRLGTKGYVGLQILVDGKVANPKTGKDFALCSSTDRVGAVRVAFIVVAGGTNHTVRVKAGAFGGATGWRLDDSTILIEN